MQQGDLFYRDERPWGFLRTFALSDAFAERLDPAAALSDWYCLGDEVAEPLRDCDVIFMRKDPPFDMEYIYTTYLLERAENDGVLVVNRPASLRDCNEKFFATAFPQCGPPLVVTRRADVIREFQAKHKHIVLKPLDGMGGTNIFRLMEGDPNLSVVIETLTQHGRQQIMAQVFLPRDQRWRQTHPDRQRRADSVCAGANSEGRRSARQSRSRRHRRRSPADPARPMDRRTGRT